MRLIELGLSQNAVKVYYDPIDSHTATHFRDAPQLEELVKEILHTAILVEDHVRFDQDMGRVVGLTDGVTNDPGDSIVYAKRRNRDIYTSFNKTKSAQPCSIVSVAFDRYDDASYILVSAWIGSFDSPPFPGDENQTAESVLYWTTHSLAWGTQEIQSDTLTDVCPWI